MITTAELVDECRRAVGESQPVSAVKEAVERAVRSGILGLADKPGPLIDVLFCDAGLTVLLGVVPAHSLYTLPHDHRMWAVIGVCEGREENELFRRSGAALESSGGRVVESGTVLSLGKDVIHRIRNPLVHTSLRAVHVYGGDFVNARRSMWTEPGWNEEPYDTGRATGAAVSKLIED